MFPRGFPAVPQWSLTKCPEDQEHLKESRAQKLLCQVLCLWLPLLAVLPHIMIGTRGCSQPAPPPPPPLLALSQEK